MKARKKILKRESTTTQMELSELICMFSRIEHTMHNFLHVRDLQKYFDYNDISAARAELERIYDERSIY